MEPQIYLGQRFRDKVTYFEGIATIKHTSITGSVLYTLIGEYSKDTQNYAELLVPEEMMEYIDDGVYIPKNDVPEVFKRFV